jgi:hypothetical protein
MRAPMNNTDSRTARRSAYGIGVETEAAPVEVPKPTSISSFDTASSAQTLIKNQVSNVQGGVFLAPHPGRSLSGGRRAADG